MLASDPMFLFLFLFQNLQLTFAKIHDYNISRAKANDIVTLSNTFTFNKELFLGYKVLK